jgi:hypothetical protein
MCCLQVLALEFGKERVVVAHEETAWMHAMRVVVAAIEDGISEGINGEGGRAG